jgi:hypothetical protein
MAAALSRQESVGLVRLVGPLCFSFTKGKDTPESLKTRPAALLRALLIRISTIGAQAVGHQRPETRAWFHQVAAFWFGYTLRRSTHAPRIDLSRRLRSGNPQRSADDHGSGNVDRGFPRRHDSRAGKQSRHHHAFRVGGRVVWVARTLCGADQLADEYKYIPVRRLALY